MPDRLGSHWRWRVAMLLLAVGLIGYGWWQAERWESRELMGRGAFYPALYRVPRRDGSQLVEAFDWKTGRTWTVANVDRDSFRRRSEEKMRVSPDNDTIMWTHGRPAHLADIVALKPATRHRFASSHYGVTGTSHDARFAVFQIGGGYQVTDGVPTQFVIAGGWESPHWPAVIVFVVELASGKIVSWRESQSSMYQAIEGRPDTFQSRHVPRWRGDSLDPWEPQYANWKLNSEGEWELLETVERPSKWPRYAFDFWAIQESNGAWQLCEEPKSPGNASNVRFLMPIASSTERFVAYFENSRRIYTGDLDSKRVVESPLSLPSNLVGAFDGDGRVMVCSDSRDDILVLDITTGQTIAKEASGSSRRHQLLAVGIALLVLAAVWARMALVEANWMWGLCDALIANLLVQAAIFPIYSFLYHDELRWALTTNWFEIVPAFLFRGALTGAVIAVGWYWAFGRERLVVRWLLGTIWLAACAVPVVLFEGSSYPVEPWMIFQVFLAATVVASALVAAMAALVRARGWHLGSATADATPWRFSLAMLFVLITVAGIGIMLGQSVLAIPQVSSIFRPSHWSILAIVVGVLLAGILFVQSRQALLLGLLLIALSVVATAAVAEYQAGASLGFAWNELVGGAMALATALPGVVLPCLVLRKGGWRWTQTRPIGIAAEVAV